MKFIDWFAGIGGFRLGMEQAGHECVGFCEYDKFAVASYVSMHLLTEEQREYLQTLSLKQRQKEILKEEYKNGEWYASDVRRVDAGSVPAADCWCFGFPCQDISVAGKQKGFKGNRSSLFFAVTRLLGAIEEESRPKYLFIENVKNLLSVNRGYDFARLLTELDEIGYDAEWSVVNSKNFGVPQNRERVFIVGHLRGRSGRKVFPVTGTAGENSISIVDHRDGYRRNMQTYDPSGITESLDTAQGGGREFHVALPGFCDLNYGAGLKLTENARCLQSRYYKGVAGRSGEISGVALPLDTTDSGDFTLPGNNFNQRNVVHPVTGISRTLISSGHSGNEPKVAIPVLTPERAEKRQNGRRFKENGEPMFTLTSQDRHGVAVGVALRSRTEGQRCEIRTDELSNALTSNVEHSLCGHLFSHTKNEGREIYAIWHEKYQCYMAVRKLTPRECFRLQGWPDNYFCKAQEVNSDSQLYKQAGNGVTVTVINAIAGKLIK